MQQPLLHLLILFIFTVSARSVFVCQIRLKWLRYQQVLSSSFSLQISPTFIKLESERPLIAYVCTHQQVLERKYQLTSYK